MIHIFNPSEKIFVKLDPFPRDQGENKKSIQKPTKTAPKHWIFLATNRRIDVYRMVTTTLRNITPETNQSGGRRKTYSRGLQPYGGFCDFFEVDKNTENDLKNQAKRIMIKSTNEKVITSWQNKTLQQVNHNHGDLPSINARSKQASRCNLRFEDPRGWRSASNLMSGAVG